MANINVPKQKFTPTLDKENRTEHGENFQDDFNMTMQRHDVDLTEVDQMLNEKKKSLKKQIWDLAKMESLVHDDQKLSAIYNEMSEDGEEKYGYHYNETIMNIIFNEYVLNSVKYLSKYKSAIPVEKKRRDKSGINKLQDKSNGEDKKEKKDDVDEVTMHNNSLPGVQSDNLNPQITELSDNNGGRRDGFGDENDRDYLNHRIEKKHNVMNTNEDKRLSDVDTDEGKMHRLLDIPQDKEIKDVYSDGKKLAKDLMDKVGDEQEVTGMLAFAANINDEHDVFDEALSSMKEIDETTSAAASGSYSAKAGFDPMNKNQMMYESSDNLEALKSQAEEISKKEGVAQHVNKVGEQEYAIEDFYDEDNTVASYEGGRQINEGKAYSEDQRKAAGAALAAKRGEMEVSELQGASKDMYDSMSEDELEEMASGVKEEHHMDETTTSTSSGAYETPYAFAKGKGQQFDKPAWDGGEMVNESYLTNPDTFKIIYESLQEDDDPCWDGYEMIGMKTQDGEEVPNCVPIDEDTHDDSLVPNALEEHHLNTHAEKAEFIAQKTGQPVQIYLALNDDVVDSLYRAIEDYDSEENVEPEMEESIIDDQPDSMAAHMKGGGMMEDISENKKCRSGEIPNPSKETEDDPDCVKKETYYKNKQAGKYDKSKKQSKKEDRFNTEWRKEREKRMKQRKQDKKKETNENIMNYNKEMDEASKLMESIKKLSTGEDLHEDAKHPSMVNLERLKKDNKENFKDDMSDANSTEIAAGQAKAERADAQYTDVDDPQELSKKIEKEKLSQHDYGSFDNEGNSTNDTNDEIPKRNRTEDEQESVADVRRGMESWDYEAGDGERFHERMIKDMGQEIHDQGQEHIAKRKNQVMYKKDQQPVSDEEDYNEKIASLSEGSLTGKYRDNNNQTQFVSFNFEKVQKVDRVDESFVKLSLDGMGNTYTTQIHENANMRNVMDAFDFYVNNSNTTLKPIVAVKRGERKLMNEGEVNEKEPINEGLEKMKKLWGYKPSNFVDSRSNTKNAKF